MRSSGLFFPFLPLVLVCDQSINRHSANKMNYTPYSLLGFSVLPSTRKGTRKVPRSGKFARWALRRFYAGNVTDCEVMMSFCWGKSPGSSLFVRICGLLSSVELGRTLFKWTRFTRSAIEKLSLF